IVDEEFAEEFARSLDGRHARAGTGPTHHASTMEAVLGAYRDRRKAGRTPDGFGRALIDGDVAFGHALRVDGAHAAQVGVDSEVAALDAVVEAREEGEVLTVRGERFEQQRQFEIFAGALRKKGWSVEAERVAHANHARGPRGIG